MHISNVLIRVVGLDRAGGAQMTQVLEFLSPPEDYHSCSGNITSEDSSKPPVNLAAGPTIKSTGAHGGIGYT